MYGYDNDILPELSVDMFIPVQNIHDYNSREAAEHHFYVTFHGTTRRQKCITYFGAHVWNFILTKGDPNCSICLFINITQFTVAILCFRVNILRLLLALPITNVT